MNSDVNSLFSYQSKSSSKDRHALLPDPFCDFASTAMPKTKSDVLRLCEHVWLMSGQFKTAMQRIIRYFLTDVEISGSISDDEKDKYTKLLNDHLGILGVLADIGDDLMCYGNSFSSLYMPFNRMLICDICNFSVAMTNVKNFKLDTKTLKFSTNCVRCGKSTMHTKKDLRSMDESRIAIIRWNPHEIELTHDFISDTTEYTWKIDKTLKSKIKSGDEFWIRKMPWDIVEAAIKKDTFTFRDGAVYHIKESTISGVQNRGWGIPRMLGAFKDVYYVQMLKRYNEALALDYIVPFRVVTPQKAGTADPMMHQDMNMWTSNLNQLLEDHRKNPTGYHTLPFPVQYQALSGEGVKLSPFQLIKQGNEDLKDAIGVPVNLFHGDMDLQSAPTALRLFQSSWPNLVSELDGWLTWVAQNIGNFFGWDQISAKLQPVTYADDIDRKHMLLQMQSAHEISKRTAFSFLNVDPKEEARRILEEQKDQMDAQREFEEDQMKADELRQMSEQASQMGGGGMPPMDGGGAPPPQPVPGVGVPMAAQPGSGAISPEELMNQAQEMAQQLNAMDETTRRSQLIQMKRSNPMLHAQVSQIRNNMRQQAATQGVAAMHQQAAQGGGM